MFGFYVFFVCFYVFFVCFNEFFVGFYVFFVCFCVFLIDFYVFLVGVCIFFIGIVFSVGFYVFFVVLFLFKGSCFKNYCFDNGNGVWIGCCKFLGWCMCKLWMFGIGVMMLNCGWWVFGVGGFGEVFIDNCFCGLGLMDELFVRCSFWIL